MTASKSFLGLLFVVAALTQISTSKKIKILSDFTTFQDKEFFKTTFPWIAHNVGPKLRVKYYLKGEKDGKRMCVLDNLKRNLLLQADYMKCEANGEQECLKNLPIDHRKLDKCIRKGHKTLRKVEKQFRKYRPSETPVIIRGRSQQTVHDPKTVLFNICGMFGRKQPEGCWKPSEAPVPATPSTTECTQKPSDTTTPVPGGNNTTIAPGGNNTTPAPGGNNTTPASGGNNTTPAPGGNNTTPVPGGNNDTTTAPSGTKDAGQSDSTQQSDAAQQSDATQQSDAAQQSDTALQSNTAQ
ncbi:uncharacterized protein LOC125230423 [Leguminivora glycinivorella]|uniref:uncharacterized protein LOC125230423 n=1 Tax=Leguminivora glycinivorella TaxID=1035111 RepID=UPI00200EEA37|nr:uncharacterized protein LOC125230423 [Leguminivora glycinivorella]